jgi:hypothetical protein
VQVADDRVLHLLGIDADRGQSFSNGPDDDAATLGGHGVIEAGVHHKCAVRTANHPDEIRQRLEDVVWIAADVVLVGLPVMMRVADGIHLVQIALP